MIVEDPRVAQSLSNSNGHAGPSQLRLASRKPASKQSTNKLQNACDGMNAYKLVGGEHGVQALACLSVLSNWVDGWKTG